jgi:hypothetical protein
MELFIPDRHIVFLCLTIQMTSLSRLVQGRDPECLSIAVVREEIMSPRARPAAAALLCLSLAIAAMAAVGLSCALRLIAQNLIDTAEGAGAEIYQQTGVPLRQAGADPVKSLRDDVELQRFLGTSRASRRSLVYARVETDDGQMVLTAERGATNRLPGNKFPIEDLRRQLRSPLPLALLPALWSPHTFVLRRPISYDGHNFAAIDVGVSTAFMADDLRAQFRVLAWSAIPTLGLTWLAFCLLASRSQTGDSLRPITANHLIEAGLPDGQQARWNISRPGKSPETFTAADDAGVALVQDSLLELLDSIGDGALTIDPRGVVGFANAKARYLLGDRAAMPGQSLGTALGSQHPLVQILEAALAGPARPQHVQLDVFGSRNRFGPITVSAFPAGHDRGLVVLLGEPAPIDELQDGSLLSSEGSPPNGAPRHSALVEITVSEQGKLGIHPSSLRELLDLYFATPNSEASGPALVSRALELHRGIDQQVDRDQVIARIRLPVSSAQNIQALGSSDAVTLAQSRA